MDISTVLQHAEHVSPLTPTIACLNCSCAKAEQAETIKIIPKRAKNFFKCIRKFFKILLIMCIKDEPKIIPVWQTKMIPGRISTIIQFVIGISVLNLNLYS